MNNLQPPLSLTQQEISDLIHAGYLKYLHPLDVQPNLRELSDLGDTVLLALTKVGVPLDSYPKDTLTLKDLLLENSRKQSPIITAIQAAKSPKEAAVLLNKIAKLLPSKDRKTLISQVQANKALKTDSPAL